MAVSDRTISLGLFVSAGLAWLVVAWILTNLSPVGSAFAQLFGALALGTATALTACPLIWLVTAGRRAEPPESSWTTAGRRAGLIGLVIGVLILLRVIDALALPVLAFLVVTAVLVELALTVRR